MKKPNPKPLNPQNPRSKKVNVTPLPRLYPETMTDDINTLEEISQILNKIDSHEDNKQNNS